VCIAHGFPQTPDVAIYQVRVTDASVSSIPIALMSRGTTAVMGANLDFSGVESEMFAQVVHGIIT
jgi:hypothetical protein